MSTETDPLFTADPDSFQIMDAGPARVTLPPMGPGGSVTVENCGTEDVHVGQTVLASGTYETWTVLPERRDDGSINWKTERASPSRLWPCGCLRNDAGAHRVGCPDHPEGVRG